MGFTQSLFILFFHNVPIAEAVPQSHFHHTYDAGSVISLQQRCSTKTNKNINDEPGFRVRLRWKADAHLTQAPHLILLFTRCPIWQRDPFIWIEFLTFFGPLLGTYGLMARVVRKKLYPTENSPFFSTAPHFSTVLFMEFSKPMSSVQSIAVLSNIWAAF